MLPVPVFSSWRLLWDQDRIMKNLANSADSLAKRRNQIRAGSDEVRGLSTMAPRLREFLYLRQQRAQQLKQQDPDLLYHSYVLGIAEFGPIIEAARWARWLSLEQALADAMQYGDLLFGALILRTQIEDLGALLRLEQIERYLVANSSAIHSGSGVVANLAAVEEGVDFVWERFLPRFVMLSPEQMGERKPDDLIIQWPDELARSFSALNDYVHPNYGSHMAAIFPEKSAAGSILLTAFNAIYNAFFRLEFVKRCPAMGLPASSSFPVSYVKVLRRFVERSLPRLDHQLQKKRGYPEQWTPEPLSIFNNRIERETGRHRIKADDFLDLSDDPASQNKLEDMVSDLRPLCSAIDPKHEWSKEEILQFAGTRIVPTVALNPATWVLLGNLRGLARELEFDAKRLPTDVLFPQQPPFDQWIGFAGRAIQLSILTTEHKIDLMRFAAMRMINQENALGAILCARSMLEHYSVAKKLSDRFSSGVKSLEETARSGRDVVPQFELLEQAVGRFLIGTKATSELDTKWKERWNRLGIEGHLNIAQAVESTFAGDWRDLLYNYFSLCAHGNQLTGGDLLRPGSEFIVAVHLAKAVMVLAASEALEWTLDYFSPVVPAKLRMERPGGAAKAESLDELSRALRKGTTFGQPLKPGRDVFGQGTEADPYRFRKDLQYHETFYQFCHERGIDISRWKRQAWLSDGRFGDCLTSPDGQQLYFRGADKPWTMT